MDLSPAASSGQVSPSSTGQTLPSHLLANIHHLLNVKLDANNYHLWRSQFLPILRAHDLMGYVDGSFRPPVQHLADGSINPAFTAYFKQDQLILSWLISSLTESVLAQVLSHESAAGMWKALSAIYAPTSQARIQQLELQLRSLKKGPSTMAEFLQKTKSLAHQLAVAGSPLSDQQLIVCILSGIGPEYAALAASVTSRLDPMPLDEFTGILTAHDMLFQAQPTEPSTPALANHTSVEPPPYRGAPTDVRHRGRGQPRFGNRGRGRGRHNIYCQLCNRSGHLAINCFHRTNFSSYPTTRQPPTYGPLPSSHLSMATNAPEPWVLDSGATHHITQDLSNLQLSSPYNGTDRVQVGNGADLHIQNTGPNHWHGTSPWDS